MGQAKLRGSFADRKQAAIERNAADDAAQRKRVAEERFALNEWRRENPVQAARERQERHEAQAFIAMAVGIGLSVGYTPRIR